MYRYIETLMLAEIVAKINDKKLAEAFLRDVLTPAERDEIESRLRLVKMLLKGIPQREIAKKMGISLCKITRGSRELKYGAGGFKRLLA